METVLLVLVFLAVLFFLGIFKGVHSRPTGRGDYEVSRHIVDGRVQFSIARHDRRYEEINIVTDVDLMSHRDFIFVRRQDGSLWQYDLATHAYAPYQGDVADLRLRPVREVWESL